MERLDKVLASRMMGSRRDARILCKRGRVSVDGETVRDASAKIDPEARICIDDVALTAAPRVALYHKPHGVVSTMRDTMGRPCLADVLPTSWRKSMHPVGRLDAETTGLLLFSSEGQITQRLLHPKHVVEREYVAIVEGAPEAETLGPLLAAGVETAEGVVPATLQGVRGDQVRLIVTEGKHRMVRRILANVGHPVIELHRLRYGGIELGEMKSGQVRAATDEEMAWIDDL